MGSATSRSIRRAERAIGAVDRADWSRRASRIYEDLRGPATGLIRRAYGQAFSDDEIDDVYSNAWLGTLRALERRQAEMEDAEIRSYVLTAVANHASKELRRRRRKPIAPLEAAGSVAEVADTPEDAAASSESARVTRDVLSSLPPRRRAVMLLRYGWGLEPGEVCGMVKGLSPRAYRKEITRGVDEVASRIKLVEEGKWCQEREPLLKSYASGLADRDEALQAEHHLSHCRHCHEFVGKLTGQLHDLGTAVLVPGMVDAMDGHSSLLDRVASAGERIRDAAASALSRADPSEAAGVAMSTRGAGAAGAGVVAKLAGMGTVGKVALACLGGGAAATACVAAGIAPLSVSGGGDPPAAAATAEHRPAGGQRDGGAIEPPDHRSADHAPITRSPKPGPAANDPTHDPAPEPEPGLAPATPPDQQEFGLPSAAPTTSSPGSSGGGTSDPVKQEFGP